MSVDKLVLKHITTGVPEKKEHTMCLDLQNCFLIMHTVSLQVLLAGSVNNCSEPCSETLVMKSCTYNYYRSVRLKTVPHTFCHILNSSIIIVAYCGVVCALLPKKYTARVTAVPTPGPLITEKRT